ncbi:MAG: rhomboid family intramembrane serine protease, partial [Pseudobdellovibrionaceae bacterium]
MFLLPIGLEAKTSRTPIATIAIVVSTVIAHFYFYPQVKQAQDQIAQQAMSPAVLQTLYGLTVENCTQIASPEVCVAIRSAGPMSSYKEAEQHFERKFGSVDKSKLSTKMLNQIIEAQLSTRFWTRLSLTNSKVKDSQWFRNLEVLEEQNNIVKKEILKRYEILAPGNVSLKTILKSIFLHAGISHLLSNMIFLIFLCMAVEARLGSLLASAIYLIGGLSGALYHITFSLNDAQGVMGASGSVSAIGGAFLFLFWTQRMRMLASFLFFFNKTFTIPVVLFFGVFVLLSDFAGAINYQNNNVAHLYHLASLVMGGAIGMTLAKLRPLPEPFVNLEEHSLFLLFKETPEYTKKSSIIRKALRLNPNNTVLIRHFLKLAYAKSWDELSPTENGWISANLLRYVEDLFKTNNNVGIQKLFKSVPLNWPLLS